MTIGTRLKQARIDARLSQEQAGKIAGVTKQSISAIENDQTQEPKASTLEPLARRLGISLQWLMTGKGERRADSGNSATYGVKPVNEGLGESGIPSQLQQLSPEILLEAERWALIFEAAAGEKWSDLQRKRKEAEVYAAIAADGGKLSDEHHADFLSRLTALTRKRTGGVGDERGKESAGQPAARRVGGRN